MYIYNFPQTSNNENWTETFSFVAADDLTPIDATRDNIVLTLQLWARSPRGYGDQSQRYGAWPLGIGNIGNCFPAISASTNDGSGQITLNDGLLNINIPLGIMQQLSPGYWEVGVTMQNTDIQRQLLTGLLPIYTGGAWPLTIG